MSFGPQTPGQEDRGAGRGQEGTGGGKISHHMNEANAAILGISEQLLSSADMSYRKQMYTRSSKIYDLALQSLRPLRGSSNQEMMSLQVRQSSFPRSN